MKTIVKTAAKRIPKRDVGRRVEDRPKFEVTPCDFKFPNAQVSARLFLQPQR